MEKIHLIPTAGLCNRMRAMASGLYISQRYQLPLVVFWNRYKGLNATFSDLFEQLNPMLGVVKESTSWKRNINYTRDYLLRRPFLLDYNQVIYNFSQHEKGNIFEKIKCTKGKILLISCFEMTEMYDLNRIFIPVKSIQEQIDKIVSKFDIHTIGVHIRRTDNVESTEQSPLNTFIKILKKEIEQDSKVRFYLATDDHNTKQTMIDAFPERTITTTNSLNRNNIEGMKFAVSELFALSKTSKIIGSYYSSYSDIASKLGKIPIQYAINE